jgi:hypothetical protein
MSREIQNPEMTRKEGKVHPKECPCCSAEGVENIVVVPSDPKSWLWHYECKNCGSEMNYMPSDMGQSISVLTVTKATSNLIHVIQKAKTEYIIEHKGLKTPFYAIINKGQFEDFIEFFGLERGKENKILDMIIIDTPLIENNRVVLAEKIYPYETINDYKKIK